MANIWDDAVGVLGKVAPMLATAVGGPLAGAATSAIISALGLSPDTTAQGAAAAVIGATPDQLIALKKADEDFAVKMGQLNLDTAKLAFDDKANAREREMTIRDRTPMALGMSVTVGFFALLTMMAFHELPSANQAILNTMVGGLGTGFALVLSYYFGSSAQMPTSEHK
jgi:hypothetical protein